ncbi:MAG: hypothetical protein CMJ51_00010 [Planctomycetaceae bacterium]|nr:hypothetical protein [Planctomycetaceae bacterium]
MRRRWKILSIGTGMLALAAATSPVWVPLAADLAEPMIRKQVLEIASDLLKPRIEIARFEYTFPLSVKILELRLISESKTDAEVVILQAPDVDITLDRIPILGGPIVFREFVLDGATARFLSKQDGELLGWSDLLKGDDPAEDEKENERPISDIFSIDKIEVKDFAVEYALVGVEEKMVLDGLDFEIDSKSKQGSKSIDLGRGPGWYEVDTRLNREGLFDISVAGGLDIDTLMLDISSLDLDLIVDDDSTSYLPPQLQGIVKARRIDGRIDASISGTIDLDDARRDDTKFSVRLRPTRLAIDDYNVEISKGTMEGSFKDEVLRIDPISISLFDGTITATAKIADEVRRGLPDAVASTTSNSGDGPEPAELERSEEEIAGQKAIQNLSQDFVPSEAFDAALKVATGLRMFTTLDVDRIQLSKIHRIKEEPTDQVSGLFSAGIEADTNLGRPLVTFGGGGEIEVVDGVFGSRPLIAGLARLMRVVTFSGREKDWLTMTFLIRDRQVEIQTVEALAGAIGLRGTGRIGFDGTLDLSLNGGPLEGLQATAGTVGRLTGWITDRLAKYVVTGSVGSPRISVAPLGIRIFD